ncbi:hypothetical protein Mgra_00006056 [Meloidogyne graminicola]|uniref:ATP-dependent RNA helicase n=1 Tax=Meloidogyne graminicola TaxID=189291 RepID=A0A8S9ZMG8_9BILA|nr:hypothetical protein Mgra_00006056 [Meloidogyne graminicola]
MESDDGWSKIIPSAHLLERLNVLGFTTPTQIQKAVIPQAINFKKDIIGAAETGSGKTLAFAIPTFIKWLDENKIAKDNKTLFALVVSPTRELAIQIRDVFRNISAKSKFRPLNIIAIVGGMSIQKQQRLLKSCPDIIVGTPGRIWALKESGEKLLNELSGLRVIIVDEIDRMLKEGHFRELRHIIKYLHGKRKEQFEIIGEKIPLLQTMVFSATLTFTLPNEEKFGTNIDSKQKVKQIARSMYMRKGNERLAVIDLTTENKIPSMLIESRMDCMDLLHKDTNLFYLFKRYEGRTLVFCNSVSAVRRLQAILRKLNDTPTFILHGRMKEKDRLKNLEKFSSLENSILLATDVAARGLDFQLVKHIIHYQVPQTAEEYIHRSGRTARAFNSGLSILFVDPTDLNYYQKICRGLGKDEDLEVLTIDNKSLFENCKYLMELATESESIEHHIRKRQSKYSWFQRMAKEADLIWENSENPTSSHNNKFNNSDNDQIELTRRLKKNGMIIKKVLQTSIPLCLSKENDNERSDYEQDETNAKERVRKRIMLERGGNRWLKKRPKIKQKG